MDTDTRSGAGHAPEAALRLGAPGGGGDHRDQTETQESGARAFSSALFLPVSLFILRSCNEDRHEA
jgi:hypothetical protein